MSEAKLTFTVIHLLTRFLSSAEAEGFFTACYFSLIFPTSWSQQIPEDKTVFNGGKMEVQMRLNCCEKFKDKEVLSISPMINYVESRSIEQ